MNINSVGSTGKRRPSFGNRTPFALLQREMGDIFDDFLGVFQPVQMVREKAKDVFSPQIDICENENQFIVKADLPGMSEENVEVNLTEDSLILKGERKEEREEKDEKNSRRYVERTYGAFERVIPLTVEIERDKVDASFKRGVLTVILPKSQKNKNSTRTVNIRSE